MKRWERWSLNSLLLVVALTGFAYFWMKYLIEPQDPFAVVNHPWQSAMLNLHVVASPVLMLVFGIVFNSHVMKKLRAPRLPNRRTGWVSLATFALMVLSGYFLQIASSGLWLQAFVAAHVASGAVFTLAYGAHLLITFRLARARERQGSVAFEVA
ncbi:MAG: hypothetical protein HY655_00135 [Acidobacteria bacterium]|nr:hypothetical protein [Acidobacteriota bacterium]